MHELALAMNIVEIAEAQARAAGATAIQTVRLDVGRLAGVDRDALCFCFEIASRGTAAADARLAISEISGRGRCPGCGQEIDVDDWAVLCPRCHSGLVITRGRELRVCSLDVA